MFLYSVNFFHSIIFYVIMDEPIITFGSESLILEMFPETIPDTIIEIPEPVPEPLPQPTPEPVPQPKKWCSIS